MPIECNDHHLSQLGLDRLLAGETKRTEEMRTHLAECQTCQARYTALAEQRRIGLDDAFVAERVDAIVTDLAEITAH